MRSWCFDSVATTTDGVTSYDREYGSADIREVVGKLIGNGDYATPATNMQVIARLLLDQGSLRLRRHRRNVNP